MKRYKKIYAGATLLIATLFLSMNPADIVFGAEKESQTVDFSVNTVPPENQRNKEVTYFDLDVKPSFKQQVALDVTNTTDKEITVQYEVTNARSTMNGLIDYSPSKAKVDPSLVVPLTSVIRPVEKKAEVIIPANQIKQVLLEISTPKNLEPGIILGGINFSLKKETEEGSKSKGTVVENAYSIVKGIQLTYGAPPAPSINIQKASVFKFQRKPMVLITIQNDQATIIWDLTVNTTVLRNSDNKVVLKKAAKKMEMAPNSSVDVPFPWEEEKIPPGEYTAEVIAKAANMEWKKTISFKVTEKESNLTQLDESERTEKPKPPYILYLLLGLLALILVALIVYVVHMKRKSTPSVSKRKKGNKR